MEPDRFMTKTLRHATWGPGVARILAAALNAVDPQVAVSHFLSRQGGRLQIAGRSYSLRDYQRIFVVGGGKAGAPMTRAAVEVLGDEIAAGIVIVKDGYGEAEGAIGPVEIIEAGHPLPDARGVAGSQRIADLLAETTEADLVISLISGGGSALLTLPAPGLTLDDLRGLTETLLACGATINEFNSLRKQVDLFKGGGLAQMAAPAQMVTLILSDVVGNPLDIIASGPTVPDPDTFQRAFQVLTRYGIRDQVPPKVVALLEAGLAGKVDETPKPGDPLFDRVVNVLVGNNLLAAEAACTQAAQEGYRPLLLTTALQGEAREVGRVIAAIGSGLAGEAGPLPRPACVVIGGETTVTIMGNGKGGRNQELALGAVADLAGIEKVALVALATDGGDGATDAAGAVVTGETLKRAREAGLHPDEFLACNNSYNFFEPLGDLLKPGPTRTNVNDLVIVFAF